jgi:hypothetical protein
LLSKERFISAGWNAIFSLGAALVSYGFWLAWHPLGFIVFGLIIAILGFGGGFEQARKVGRRR